MLYLKIIYMITMDTGDGSQSCLEYSKV